MTTRESGLTVGQLTIAVAALLIAVIAWTTFKEQGDQSKNYPSLKIENILC